jgi:hypothetical protein
MTAESSIRRVPLEIRGNLRKFFTLKNQTEIVLDGPAGTGKTRVALERQHLIQTMYPGARGLIVRKYRSSMNETCLQVLDKEVFCDKYGKLYQDAPHWAERDQKYIYSNGSETIVAGMDDPTKVMSSQYDWFYWNELIEGQEAEWMAIMSRLRNGRVPYQQAIGDTNPGPPQHWILTREKAGRLLRLPTNHKDNPVYWDIKKKRWTAKGNAYVNGILRDGLTGTTRDRLYDGKWVSAEGLVYPQWDFNVHVIPKRTLPRNWPRYWVFDFGSVDPFVWIELTEDPDTNTLYLTKELYHTHLLVEDAAKMIKEATVGTVPYALICDHDAEDRATLERHLGFLTVPAFKPINIGIQYVQHRLRKDNPKFNGQRGLYVMHDVNIKVDQSLKNRHKPCCTEEEFSMYQWDTGKIQLDKYKDAPIDKNNHGMDVVRYGTCFVDDASIDPQEFTRYESYNELEDDDDYEDPYGSISIY